METCESQQLILLTWKKTILCFLSRVRLKESTYLQSLVASHHAYMKWCHRDLAYDMNNGSVICVSTGWCFCFLFYCVLKWVYPRDSCYPWRTGPECCYTFFLLLFFFVCCSWWSRAAFYNLASQFSCSVAAVGGNLFIFTNYYSVKKNRKLISYIKTKERWVIIR